LAAVKEEIEAESREQERRLLEESDGFRDRYCPTVGKVCQAFANSVGWEYVEPLDAPRRAFFVFNPFRLYFGTVFCGHEDYPDGGSLWLTLRSAAHPPNPKELDIRGVPLGADRGFKKHVSGRSRGTGGEIEVCPYLRVPDDGTGMDYSALRQFARELEVTTFAGDIGLDTFESVVADALEDQYKRLTRACADSHVGI
jgi:hypothetical protein